MKLFFSTIFVLNFCLLSFGQAPESFNYQAVVRDAGGIILANQNVGIKLTILQGGIGGTTAYSETFTSVSNGFGLINIEIGTGTTAYDFTTIDWASGPYYIETAIDISGGTSYVTMGTSQLVSVPYALYAKTSGSSTPGPQGIQGVPGNDGAQGPQGIQGPAGNDGTQGIQGPIGMTGPQGIQGMPGNDGAQGPQGIQGPIGLTGPQGMPGNDGAQGPQGIQGPIGLTGPQGIPGNDGAQGPMGPIGLTGPQGVPGNDGAQGLQGIQGPIGLTGPQGIPGNDGTQGLQGIQGPAGINGVGISSTVDNGNGTFTFNFTDGNTFTTSIPASTGGSGFQIFSASGTFTVPTGVTQIIVEVWGAGGGGARLDGGTGGAGGGGGGYGKEFLNVSSGGSYIITIGVGGPGATTNSTAGQNGGLSDFGGLVSATGGQGGQPNPAGGGNGGASSAILSNAGIKGSNPPSHIPGSGGKAGGFANIHGSGGAGTNNAIGYGPIAGSGQNGLIIITW